MNMNLHVVAPGVGTLNETMTDFENVELLRISRLADIARFRIPCRILLL